MAVAHFGLYGEAATPAEPGFVHIEDIAVRSREVDWRIKSHRHSDLFQMVYIAGGAMTVILENAELTLSDSVAVTLPPGVVHGFTFKPDTEGKVLTIASSLINEHSARSAGEMIRRLGGSAEICTFDPRSVRCAQFIALLEQIDTEFRQAERGRDTMLEHLAILLLLTVARQLDQQQIAGIDANSASAMLTGFRDLLELHFTDHWGVRRYADTLGTSVSSLNRRCKAHLGVPASAIIHARVLVEAKRRLLYTRDSVDEVGFRLGFRDAAYFSRFFSRMTGVPPGRYRRQRAL